MDGASGRRPGAGRGAARRGSLAWAALAWALQACTALGGSGQAPTPPPAGASAAPASAMTAPGATAAPASPARAADATAEPGESKAGSRRRPNYGLAIDAPAAVREAIERQTLVGKWRDRPDFEPDQFEAIRARLPEEADTVLKSLGYFDAKVTVGGDRDVVKVDVSAGPRATVARVTLRIEGPVSGDSRLTKLLAERWTLPEGAFFTADAWTQGKRAWLQALHEHGYLRARIVHSEARVDAAASSVALELQLASGEQLAFGPLRVSGLSRYARAIVDNLRPFDEGEPYSTEQLFLYQTRLREAGWFSSAQVLPDLVALDADPSLTRVPIDVDLTERREKRVTFGIGYSTDQGPRTQVGFEHFDLLGRSWLLQSGVIVEGLRQRVFATVRTPPEKSGHYWMFGSRFDRQNIEGERIARNTTFVGRGKRAGEIEHFVSLQYQIESSTIELANGDLASDVRRALVPGYTWSLRRLDSRLDPRSGYSISAQVSGAHSSLLSDRTFGRLYVRAMRFLPMPSDSPLAGGFLVGLLEGGAVLAGSREDIPSENLFRAGGSQSIRGYAFQSLGVPVGNAIVGGRYLGVASLEYQHPVAEDWRAAVFYDRGNATDTLHPFNAVAGYGVGARWHTPIGPVNLDLAYGQAERRWRIHFSVGYTF